MLFLPTPRPRRHICWLGARAAPSPLTECASRGVSWNLQLVKPRTHQGTRRTDGRTDGAQQPHAHPPPGQECPSQVPPQPPMPCSDPAAPETPSCPYRNRNAKVSLLQTINSLFIVSICSEAATLISGLLHKAYSRLLSELKRQTQMPRSSLPTSLTWLGRSDSRGFRPGSSSGTVPMGLSCGGAQCQHPGRSTPSVHPRMAEKRGCEGCFINVYNSLEVQ